MPRYLNHALLVILVGGFVCLAGYVIYNRTMHGRLIAEHTDKAIAALSNLGYQESNISSEGSCPMGHSGGGGSGKPRTYNLDECIGIAKVRTAENREQVKEKVLENGWRLIDDDIYAADAWVSKYQVDDNICGLVSTYFINQVTELRASSKNAYNCDIHVPEVRVTQ